MLHFNFQVVATVLLFFVILENANAASSTWTKLNCRPVCYSGKGNSYGIFLVDKHITAHQVKLVHVSGKISCAGVKNYGIFNCPHNNLLKRSFEVHLTDSDNKVIVPAPPVQYAIKEKAWYHLHGNIPGTNNVVFSTGSKPYTFKKENVYRVWYGEDLFGIWEGDNLGTLCVDVYALQ